MAVLSKSPLQKDYIHDIILLRQRAITIYTSLVFYTEDLGKDKFLLMSSEKLNQNKI